MQTVPATWYFDVISPFAYLHLKQRQRWHPDLQVAFTPVLFAGLLKHHGQKGPAEIDGKRVHTYQYCAWWAKREGIALRMPPRHPFNPLAALRLLTALGSDAVAVARAFDFIWAQGRDPEAEWDALCAYLDAGDAAGRVGDAQIKAQLLANTDRAIAAGVFGVPSLVVRDQVFWG